MDKDLTNLNSYQVNIENRDKIEFVQFPLIDSRIDLLIYQHYGYKYTSNYNITAELFVYLILVFNDTNNINNLPSQIKLPNINMLLDNIVLINNEENKINGVYNSIIAINQESSNVNNIINELELKLSKVKYDSTLGIIKF